MRGFVIARAGDKVRRNRPRLSAFISKRGNVKWKRKVLRILKGYGKLKYRNALGGRPCLRFQFPV